MEGQIDLMHMPRVKTIAEPFENVRGAETHPKPPVTDKDLPMNRNVLPYIDGVGVKGESGLQWRIQ